jgi:hypothetical protein
MAQKKVVRAGGEAPNFPSGRLFGTKVFMASQDTLQPTKKPGPAPTGQGTPVQVRLQPVELAALDKWRDNALGQPSRPEAI